MIDIIRDGSPVPLTLEMLNLMADFFTALVEKNKVMNLTSVTNPKEAAEIHFIDSLYPLTLPCFGGRVADIGSGGGLPAFPIAIASGLEVNCIDASRKKAEFLSSTAKQLCIGNIKVSRGRAEVLALDKKFRDSFDTVVARGVAKLGVLSELCLPFVKPGGYFVSMKGDDIQSEIDSAKNAVKALGGEVTSVTYYKLPITGRTRSLVCVKKVFQTPKGFPRAYAAIIKKPL